MEPVPNYAAGVSQEILNYFGTCGACGYPAQAHLVSALVDGHIATRVVATCGLPCGWRSVCARTTMT
ncbi:hypothetical protein ATM97_12855 [Nocardia sp. MH4]|uniref:hypothetical protein n=1 Tax=Nocardia TaxID=1817 RepID=UPI001C4F47BA|nr:MULTISPECIES: hypothetical protein [Nocardia]MBW0271640.1 hypothetical protein [Nocardia sp. MH4]